MVAHTGDLSILEAHELVASLCYMEILYQNKKTKKTKTPNSPQPMPTTKNRSLNQAQYFKIEFNKDSLQTAAKLRSVN